MMQVIHERCAALDVHKKTVVTTIMMTQADGSVQEEVRTFLTMTADLLALDDWLRRNRVEVIAMESTGVFWRPVFNLLEAFSQKDRQQTDSKENTIYIEYRML